MEQIYGANNKDADQTVGTQADLHLLFAYGINRFSLDVAHM